MIVPGTSTYTEYGLMSIKSAAKKVYAAIIAYERFQDYDPTTHILDRLRIIEDDLANLKRSAADEAKVPADGTAKSRQRQSVLPGALYPIDL